MPVRWNSTYEIIERIVKINKPLLSTLAIVIYSKDNLNDTDWNIITYASKALKGFLK